MHKENIESAFPGYSLQTWPWFGMSLRDYFAAKAMANFCGLDVTRFDSDGRELDFADAAKQSYAYADAMLAARIHPTE